MLLHVEPLGRPLESAEVVKLRISPAHYVKLVAAIDDSFALDAYGKPIVVAGAHYDERDAFYEATGRYSLFSTCNDWGARSTGASGYSDGHVGPLCAGPAASGPCGTNGIALKYISPLILRTIAASSLRTWEYNFC